MCEQLARENTIGRASHRRRPADGCCTLLGVASSGPYAVADLIRSIKRPEPEPAGLLPLRSLGVRGSFDEPGHGWPSLERVEVVTPIDAAHTEGFAVCADLFSLSSGERIHLPPAIGRAVVNLFDPHAVALALQGPLDALGLPPRLVAAVPLPVDVAAVPVP